MKRLGLVSLLALAWADPALAQSASEVSLEPGAVAARGGFATPLRAVPAPVPPAATQIDPDTLPGRDLGTTVTPAGPIYTIDGGSRVGNNLFHSFANFDLAAGDTAQWIHTTGNPLTLENVVNRVTGGTPSQLFGTLDSTAIPNADFYFINPAGIVFGATAQVNVPAAAHFSTASELRFATGPAFQVATPDGSSLNVAAPQAFGFIGNEGGILVSGVDPGFLPNAGVLTLTAGDIAIEDSFFDTGELVLAAVGATSAEIGIDGTVSGPLGGQLIVTNSSLNSTPGGGHSGGVTLAAGDLFLGDFSNVTSLSFGALNAGNITVLAGTATLDSGSFISSDSNTAGDSGQVDVTVTGLLSLAGGSFIASDTFDTGNAGGVSIVAGAVTLGGGSFISSDSYGEGNAGGVSLVADQLVLQDGSAIRSNVEDNFGFASGDGGNVFIDVRALEMSGGSSISSDTFGFGDAGDVTVFAESASLFDGSFISSDALGEGFGGIVNVIVEGLLALDLQSYISSDVVFGNGGDVFVSAGRLDLTRGSFVSSNVLAGGTGNAGIVTVDAGELNLSESYISSDAFGDGDAGGVFVRAGNALVDFFSYISSDAVGQGNGGFVDVSIDGLLTVGFGSYISSDVYGDGFGGNVSVAADRLVLEDFSAIRANVEDAFGLALGNAGNVFVDVGTLEMSGSSSISSDTFGFGDAGNVTVLAESASLADGSFISSDALGDGFGGTVTVLVDGLLTLDLGSYISADVGGSGFGGDVLVGAGRLDLTRGSFISSDALLGSSGEAGFVAIDAAELNLSESHISSDSRGTGNAGGVFVTAGDVQLDLSYISSDAFGDGNGGGVFFTADNASLDLFSYISSDAVGQGNGGVVDVDVAGLLSMGLGTYISSDVYGDGFGGDVSVAADRLVMQDFAAIRSDVQDLLGASGEAGNVFVDVNTLEMSGGSSISSNTFGLGNAGNVTVLASNASLFDGSFISSDALGDGLGGIVNVIVDGQLTLDLESYISADVGGSKDAGDVFVSAGRLDLTRFSFISSDTLFFSTGNAGNVTVVAGTLNLTESYISSDAIGDGDAGIVDVDAGDLTMALGSYISSDSLGLGDAGGVFLNADRATLRSNSFISSNALFAGNAGGVFITGGSFSLDDSSITSEAAVDGNGGNVSMNLTGALELSGSRIGTDTGGEGFAGNILITAADITLDDASTISSDALPGSSGPSGFVDIAAGTLVVRGASVISTISNNANPAGAIFIDANRVTVEGVGSRISSENEFDGACESDECAAGLVRIATLGDDAEGIFLLDGGRITTNSDQGPAGNIELLMAPDTILLLQGRDNPGIIETSSGPGTGGKITISNPLAIISNGGRISALGQQGGANVSLTTPFFIVSSDRVNIIEVDGTLEFSSAISDVSAGTVSPDLTVLDASGVLRGQCSAQRASGELSQFTVREIGPYAPAAPPPNQALPPTEAPPTPGSGGSGGCL